MLKAMTSHVGVAFDERMLAWTAGPKDYEGCWADLWYRNSRRSTGFSKSVGSHKMAKAVSKNIVDLLEDVHPFWSLLKARAVRARDVLEASSPVDQEAAVRGGTHAFKQDDRNASILIGVRNGVTLDFSLVPRRLAKVSVLDAGFVLGDGVWEGIRLHKSKLLFWDEHVARLYQGAKALAMSIDLTKDELKTMVEETCVANGMESGVHIRLIVSRGEKLTPYQAPKATLGMPTIVIIPERKAVTEDVKTNGIKLITSFVRRARPDTQDPMINSLSKHQCIAACIQAEQARVNEALMLDPQGFVATCNSTNFFMVCGGQLIAPTTEYQLHGITRQNMLDLAERCGIQTKERNFSVTEVYSASECFVTGTFAGAIPVVEVDGREIGGGKRGEVTKRLQDEYSKLCDVHAGGQGGGVVEK
ncbi:class IV aminotransferase [Chloropicon primus]|nr:class IV aminotransferase [Chloropicon primus]